MTVQEILAANEGDLIEIDRRIAAEMVTRFYNLPLKALWRFTLLTSWERAKLKMRKRTKLKWRMRSAATK